MPPALIKLLSQTVPVTLSDGFPLVAVWPTVSEFVQVTVSPGEMFNTCGLKQFVAVHVPFVVLAPLLIVTGAFAAKACGAIPRIATRVRTPNSVPIGLDFIVVCDPLTVIKI